MMEMEMEMELELEMELKMKTDGGLLLCRFDSASLAILRRLDGLEELMRTHLSEEQRSGPQPELPVLNAISPLTPATILRDLDSPSLARDSLSPRYYPNIEYMFSWLVFQDQGLDERLDLKTLLQSEYCNTGVASIPSDFEHDDAGKLLDLFFENVHIYNPILEVSKVRQYLKDAQLNGLGWKAQSCLLVSTINRLGG